MDLLLMREDLINLKISIGDYKQAENLIIEAAHRKESRTVCFANVHMAVEVRRNDKFAKIVNEADWVFPDGIPLIWGLRGMYGTRQNRIAGMDLLPDLLKRASKENLPVYFYGSTLEVLNRTQQTCERLFPGLIIAGVLSPPFRQLTSEEELIIAEQIKRSGARLIFVALGCPKQEQWISRMKNRIPAILLGIGGALPVLAGEVDRAPKWMQRSGTEWLYRLIQEPRRLFKRYLITNSLYIWYLGNQWFNNQSRK